MVFIVGTPALAFSPGLDEAQQNTVVGGVVVDKNNEPLIGVSVMVEGSSGGTITNMRFLILYSLLSYINYWSIFHCTYNLHANVLI